MTKTDYLQKEKSALYTKAAMVGYSTVKVIAMNEEEGRAFIKGANGRTYEVSLRDLIIF